jgi:hypothetical protein
MFGITKILKKAYYIYITQGTEGTISEQASIHLHDTRAKGLRRVPFTF